MQSTLRELLAMPDKIVRPPSSSPAYPTNWFLKQSTVRELLVMPYKTVRPPSSYPAYLAILVSTLEEVLAMSCKSCALLPVILRTWRYRFLKQSTLGELLAMPDKIVCPPSSNPAYPAILVPEAINLARVISYTMQHRSIPSDIDS